MNLFQQILSVSKEFREHFEKENQQEERLKAVEETLASGGGGSSDGTAYKPYKKQTALFYVNYENYYNPCCINKKIGDNILSIQNDVNTLCSISITEENYDNGDILKSKLTFMYPKGYHAPAVTVLYANSRSTLIAQHLVNTDTPETYEYLASLNKNNMGSNKTVDIASIKDYDTSSSIAQTAFYVLAEIELHKSN